MSLLLEALKRAEKAKEEAQRRSQEEAAPEPSGLRLADEPPPAPQAPHVLTRDELPDIRQPLEIVTEDFGDAPSAAAAAPAPSPPPPPAQASERAAARKVFEAKFREPNPRLPFFIALGVLGAFAVGTVVYFWYQLRPPPALVTANPPRPSEEASLPIAAAVPRPQAIAVAPAPAAAIPGLPTALPVEAKPAPTAQAKSKAKPKPKPKPRPPAARTAVPPRGSARFAVKPPAAPRINPEVATGYAKYQAGDLAGARAAYEQALREEPENRDAILGLAAVQMRAGQPDAAEALYRRLLVADPRDPYAQAGLVALGAGQIDPVLAESRLKTLLAADPAAHALHFALGNQFAAQGRWAEAQQEYFEALAAEPGNADFAYNLAVSLDHLRKPQLALEYYRRSLALAAAHPASFDAQAARSRIAALSR